MSNAPEEKIGQYWEYVFNVPESESLASFYAFTEEDARKEYQEYFGVEPTRPLYLRRSW